MAVTVYTQPGCNPCKQTHDYLERNGVPHEVVDITTDPAAVEKVLALGYQQTPVIVTDNDHWSGFNPAKLAALTRPTPDAAA